MRCVRDVRLARRVFALGAAAALSCTPVLGSGFQLVEQNASGLGHAYAGQAAGVGDASAVFFNPAALTRVKGVQLVGAMNAIGLSSTFGDRGSGRPSLGPLNIPVHAGGAGGDAGGLAPVPNGYVAWEVGSRVWLGLGVNAPFGLKTEWDPDWVGRFHAIKSDVKTIDVNPTLAVKLGDRLSLGAGASYQRLSAELTQAVPYGGVAVGVASGYGTQAAQGILAQLGGASGLAQEGIVRIEGDAWTFGYNAGLLLAVTDDLRLGASYRSKIRHDLDGTAEFGAAPAFAEAGPLGALGAALNARFHGGPVTARIELPETLSVAAAWEGERFAVVADWTRTGWSSIQDLTVRRPDGTAMSTVPLHFRDTWRAGAGLSYRLADRWLGRVGTAYDKSPVRDAFRTPRLPDNDRVWAAVGVQRRLGESGAFDLGYAHIFVKEGTSERPNQDAPTSLPAGALLGSYSGRVDIVSAQLRWSF
jgi:long-chain fatty acid transport protein